MTGCLDLTAYEEVTVRLLADPLSWRVRVVEQIDIDSPNSALRRRSLQCAPLRRVLAEVLPPEAAHEESALLVLPVAPVPKGPLLEFDVEGPGGSQAFLIQRADIAAREAAYVRTQSVDAGVHLPPHVLALVEAALGFTEAQWREFQPDIESYLTAGLDDSAAPGDISEWIDLSGRVAAVLEPFANPASPMDSPVENPALVIPTVIAELDGDAGRVTEALVGYLDVVTRAALLTETDDVDTATDARVFLETLVEYGTHYDLMAVARIPLDEPFIIKTADRRPLRLSAVLNKGEQSLILNDARSNHFALRVTDPNARLSHVRAQSPAKDRLAFGAFASCATSQVHASYSFEPDRDYRIALTFRVAALRRLQLVPYALSGVLVALAAAIVILRPERRDLALLTAPGTLAASILLTREPSALGSRLRRLSNLLVVASVATLLCVATWQFVELTRST